jgi:hypothetical protein
MNIKIYESYQGGKKLACMKNMCVLLHHISVLLHVLRATPTECGSYARHERVATAQLMRVIRYHTTQDRNENSRRFMQIISKKEKKKPVHLVSRFSRLEFSAQLRLSGMSRVLKVIQRFHKHFSYHLQGECVDQICAIPSTHQDFRNRKKNESEIQYKSTIIKCCH